MNLLSMSVAHPLPPGVDHPAWPDFDLFDLNSLSSPPSWVSSTEPPNAPDDVLSSINIDPAVPAPVDYSDTFTAPPSTQTAPQNHPHIFDDMHRQQQAVAFSAYSKLPTHTSLPDRPLPNSDNIVDTALHFPTPTSPVLSDIPLTSTYPHVSEQHPAVAPVHPSILPANFPVHPPAAIHIPPSAHPEPSFPTPPFSPVTSTEVVHVPTPDSCSASSHRHSATSMPAAQKQKHIAHPLPPTPTIGRVQKQMRRYTAPKSSRYCHLCARHQRSVSMVPCGNVELGLCQKSVCSKCIDLYQLQVTGPSWACPHCQNKCPKRAKCFAYDRQTARRREKTLRAKMTSAGVPNTPIPSHAFKQ